ncbi:MAG TPA: AAA family ATPase [Clostridiaceae bacterium]|nr:AAA family ATPase [Clostridiaceae bacterium]
MHPEWENECKKLEKVKQEIESELAKRQKKLAEYRKQMRDINKEMWEGVGALSGIQTLEKTPTFIQDIMLLKRSLIDASENNKRIKMLEKQLASPYFGRIDFREDGRDAESFYIGIYGLRKDDTGEILIYDWRAPVSSMFYDYEPGRAQYKSPSGYIKGDMLLKRQYRIEKGKLILMFDSNITIEDDILQEILARSADNRMKTIVSTIQREQNQAIRYEGKRIIAVQGPAGSGKTSIALHRAAYLLYRHRGSIRAENICLYTPNGVFTEYISSVLPELGEENIYSITLTDLAQKILRDTFGKYESYSEMMEWQLSHKNKDKTESRFQSISYKASKEFISVLEKFAEIFENNIIQFAEIRHGNNVFADKEELEELFYESYRHMPLAKRLARMENLVATRVTEFEKKRSQEIINELSNSDEYIDEAKIKALSRAKLAREMEKIIRDVKNMFSIKIKTIYRMLFENSEIWSACGGILSEDARNHTIEALDSGILYYEDQAPILYLMFLLGMIDPDQEIKHVIIDEAQDYSYVAYKLFSRLYSHCAVTLLGDVNQNINPASGIGSLKSAAELIEPGNFEYFELNKSYRSTLEIMNFANRIIPSKAVLYGRSGKMPGVKTGVTAEDVCNLITDYLKSIKKENFRSIAVICRTLNDCYQVYNYLKKDLPVKLVASGDDKMPSGVLVLPSYLAKGLEFDVVVAAVLSVDEYASDEDKLFYTVCTRALHRLEVYAVQKARILERIS